ncbi:nitroreductase family protein [Penicillium brasilianum]|uniref:Nitroreductase family protein n=1 Tax=Penicillium brasilianum TaxID=104259 RepID=A0A1S9RKP5_PENBI|nr:nitroreductase family protein [Penicillium brasilianum]
MAARAFRSASNLHSICRTIGSTTCTRRVVSGPTLPSQIKGQLPLQRRSFTSSLPNSFSSSSPTSSAATMSTTDALVQAAQSRRTIYKLGKNSPVADSKIEELVNAAILNVPSSFNTQSTRLVVLLREEHDNLWDLTIETFKGLVASGTVPEEVFQKQTLPKLQGFKAAYGTILFYEDPAHIKPFQEKFATYKAHFEPWAEHSNAMHQYFLWTALETLGFGANLQHYNPLIDTPVAQKWNIPTEWRLISQLVFGSPEAAAGEKVQKPIEERVKIFGKQ